MRHFVAAIALACAVTATYAQTELAAQPGLPQLHKVQRVTLSPCYSCRSRQEFQKGYVGTALFLSTYSKKRNAPELVFNGAPHSTDYFHGQTAGDDFDLITDYGPVSLESLTLNNAFSPMRRVGSTASFANRASVAKGHTYGVLINKPEARGFFYFRVLEYVPNQKVEIEYAVMDYQVTARQAQSDGFAWDKAPSR